MEKFNNNQSLLINKLDELKENKNEFIFGDISINSSWVIEKRGNEYMLSFTRPLIGYKRASLSNYIARVSFDFKNTPIVKINLKTQVVLGLVGFAVVLFIILLISIYDRSYIVFVGFLFPFYIFFELVREKKEFTIKVNSFLNSLK